MLTVQTLVRASTRAAPLLLQLSSESECLMMLLGVQVTVTVMDDVMTLKGRSKHGFRGHLEQYRLPERAQPEKATASCIHGVLTGARSARPTTPAVCACDGARPSGCAVERLGMRTDLLLRA